jgi:hypothetical protein
MNIRKNLTVSFALTALALGLTTTLAIAQPLLEGTFELTAAAYWGDTLLQPGQYTISMRTAGLDYARTQVIHLNGEGVTKTFLTTPSPRRESGRNYLEVADVNGTHVVRAFDVGVLGKSFTFGVTRKVRSVQARATPAPAIDIPVAFGVGSN